MMRYIINAFRNMGQNPHRTVLTMLGICISIFSIVVFYTLGESINASIQTSFGSRDGHNQIYVEATEKHHQHDGNQHREQEYPPEMVFTDTIINEFLSKWDGQVTLFQESPERTGKIYTDPAEKAGCAVVGLGDDGRFVYEMEISAGRFLTKDDVAQKQPVAVISSVTAELCFGNSDPLGNYIWFEDEAQIPHQYTVIGVYQYQGTTYDTPELNRLMLTPTAFIPYTQWHEQFPGSENNTGTVRFNTTGISDTNKMRNIAQTYFSSCMQHEGWEIEVTLMSDALQSIQKYVDLFKQFITIIAIVSFIIGGIGIMNVMLISAQERVREIGIKKSLGAKNRTIITEFLTEAVILSSGGAAIGMLLGILFSYDLSNICKLISRQMPSLNLSPVLYIPVNAVLLAFAGSLLLGILCGVLPAVHAAKMNPADALRSDAR